MEYLQIACVSKADMHQYLTVYKQHYIDLYLVPWVCFNLWEFELRIIGVHAFNFFPCRGTKDLQQMINST
jgi:hypothetical protein